VQLKRKSVILCGDCNTTFTEDSARKQEFKKLAVPV
jgi:hypothetical protein